MRAFDDLAGISAFGVENWGEEAARAYSSEITERLGRLIEFPRLGPLDPVIDGVRRLNLGRHVAFYKVMDQEVVIGRVLHASQDQTKHISPSFT